MLSVCARRIRRGWSRQQLYHQSSFFGTSRQSLPLIGRRLPARAWFGTLPTTTTTVTSSSHQRFCLATTFTDIRTNSSSFHADAAGVVNLQEADEEEELLEDDDEFLDDENLPDAEESQEEQGTSADKEEEEDTREAQDDATINTESTTHPHLKIHKGFKSRHRLLFDIACGKKEVERDYHRIRGDWSHLRSKDLISLEKMLMCEFQQSIECAKQHEVNDCENNRQPFVYDIFYLDMEKLRVVRSDAGDKANTAELFTKETEMANVHHDVVDEESAALADSNVMGSSEVERAIGGENNAETRNENCLMAVCIRVQTSKEKKNKGRPMWLCENGDLLEIHPPIHTRFLGNLCGTERTWAALIRARKHAYPLSLATLASKRKKDSLVNVRYLRNKLVGQLVDMDCNIVSRLNKSQKKAIAAVVNPECNRQFVVVQGPPGCGKTTTLVGMILELSRQGKPAIVTAPSNAAVANIALKLHKAGEFEPGELCVYGYQADESVHFLSPLHRGKYFGRFRRDCEATECRKEKEKILAEFCQWMGYRPDDGVNKWDDLAELCPMGSQKMGHVGKLLRHSKIVLCTLNTAGSPLLRTGTPKGIDTFFLDEGAQCPEAEFFIATTFPGISKMVVLGDPQQLPATVLDPSVQRAGYGVSWMARIFDLHPRRVHLLDTQYRMDPKILEFSNRTFYNNRVDTGKNVLNRKLDVDNAFLFVPCQGTEERVRKSWKNEGEAALIKEILGVDCDIQAVLASNPEARIIVITPYEAQRKILDAKLEGSTEKIDVATVDSFQGQEADVVILSTVRTESVGFTDDPQRLNVALTRAKFVLRVVGDHAFFQSLCKKSSTLKKLAHFAHSNGHLRQTGEEAVLEDISVINEVPSSKVEQTMCDTRANSVRSTKS